MISLWEPLFLLYLYVFYAKDFTNDTLFFPLQNIAKMHVN